MLPCPSSLSAIGPANIGDTVPTPFPLPPSLCRNRLRSCPLWPSSSRLSWCRRRDRRVAASIATGTANTASMPATIGRISDRGRKSILAGLVCVLEVILDLLDQQAPSLVLARACGLLHRDLQIAELALDLLARQHMQAAC